MPVELKDWTWREKDLDFPGISSGGGNAECCKGPGWGIKFPDLEGLQGLQGQVFEALWALMQSWPEVGVLDRSVILNLSNAAIN